MRTFAVLTFQAVQLFIASVRGRCAIFISFAALAIPLGSRLALVATRCGTMRVPTGNCINRYPASGPTAGGDIAFVRPRFPASDGYKHDTTLERTGHTALAGRYCASSSGIPCPGQRYQTTAPGGDTGQLLGAAIPNDWPERRYSKSLLTCKPDAQSRAEYTWDTLPQAVIPDDYPGRR